MIRAECRIRSKQSNANSVVSKLNGSLLLLLLPPLSLSLNFISRVSLVPRKKEEKRGKKGDKRKKKEKGKKAKQKARSEKERRKKWRMEKGWGRGKKNIAKRTLFPGAIETCKMELLWVRIHGAGLPVFFLASSLALLSHRSFCSRQGDESQ